MTPPVDEQAPATEAPTPAAAPGDQPGDVATASKRMVLRVMKQLYQSKEMAQSLLTMIKSAGDPAMGIARAALSVIEALHTKIQSVPNGEEALKMSIGPIVIYIAELAVKAGIIPDDAKIIDKVIEIINSGAARSGQAQPQGAQPDTGEMPPDDQSEGLLNSAE